MAHGITCTQLLGKETKNGNGIGGKPGWSSQNEDDWKGQQRHDTQLAPLVTLQPPVYSLNCKTKPFSKCSPQMEPDQILLL